MTVTDKLNKQYLIKIGGFFPPSIKYLERMVASIISEDWDVNAVIPVIFFSLFPCDKMVVAAPAKCLIAGSKRDGRVVFMSGRMTY